MSVSIIGCGWLGQALAQRLLAKNTSIIASYQSQQTFEKLSELDIPATQLILPLVDDAMSSNSLDNMTNVDPRLFQQDVLIIAIPPQLKKGRLDYPLKIQQLVHLAELGNTKHIIFLNSTAIYNGLIGRVDEKSQLDLDAEKVAHLVAAEHTVKTFSKRVHILRLAGLVGPNRHPGKFLQAKRIFENANASVNLVHQDDVVNILEKLINFDSDDSKKTIYNVVSNTDSHRQGYYELAAHVLSLPLPIFSVDQQQNTGKKLLAKNYVVNWLMIISMTTCYIG